MGIAKPGTTGINLVCLEVTMIMSATKAVANSMALNTTSITTWFLAEPVAVLNLFVGAGDSTDMVECDGLMDGIVTGMYKS